MIIHPDQSTQMKILSNTILNCSKCILSKTRKNVVIGSGAIPSQILFIGEAPGSQENLQGIPFVGRAGKFFEILLNSINLERNYVYVTNILKCRPPKNRNPKSSEINHCTPYLEKQIDIIKPEILAPMGNFAARYCCKKYHIPIQNISSIHGKKFSISTKSFTGILIPLYHPAAAVYNPNLKDIMIQDFQQIKNQLSQDP